jgi:Rps23 Pro-64 3,4-dihydroxylase Tpa1-like proline 4-hydroxylase
MMPLLQAGWKSRPPHEQPFRWLSTEPGELLSEEVAQELADSFPQSSFVRRDASQRPGHKSYRNFSRPLLQPDGSAVVPQALPLLWRQLLAELTAPAYRGEVARLLDQPVARRMEVRLVKHAPGDWLSPHTDRADKLFSHIVYFNRCWREQWGGCLEILAGQDPTAVCGRIVPRLGASALLARADNSWHQVLPVAASAAPERLSLLIHGQKEER